MKEYIELKVNKTGDCLWCRMRQSKEYEAPIAIRNCDMCYYATYSEKLYSFKY
jgi:hypothetical protein